MIHNSNNPRLALCGGELEGLFDGIDDAVHVPGVDREGARQHPRAPQKLRHAPAPSQPSAK